MTYFTLSGLKSFSLTIKQFVKDNASDGHLATFICTIVEFVQKLKCPQFYQFQPNQKVATLEINSNPLEPTNPGCLRVHNIPASLPRQVNIVPRAPKGGSIQFIIVNTRRWDLVKSDLYTWSPVRNVTGDERAHARNKSSKSRPFFDVLRCEYNRGSEKTSRLYQICCLTRQKTFEQNRIRRPCKECLLVHTP